MVRLGCGCMGLPNIAAKLPNSDASFTAGYRSALPGGDEALAIVEVGLQVFQGG